MSARKIHAQAPKASACSCYKNTKIFFNAILTLEISTIFFIVENIQDSKILKKYSYFVFKKIQNSDGQKKVKNILKWVKMPQKSHEMAI